jgi:Flp pilus assembly pilin Flp
MVPMIKFFNRFLHGNSGAVAVDWTVLSASVLAMSLATVAVLNGGIQGLVSRMDAELRAQQMSDNFIQFTSAHFEPLYEYNLTTPEYAEAAFNLANDMMNQEIIDALHAGILAMEAGTLTDEEAVALVALGSVARQRNIIDSEILNYYFGFDGTAGVIGGTAL